MQVTKAMVAASVAELEVVLHTDGWEAMTTSSIHERTLNAALSVAPPNDTVNAVYTERSQLVAALSKVWPSYVAIDENEEPGWRTVVYIDSPAGQLSWHVSDADMHAYFGHLTSRANNWDGHTTDEKYKRLASIPLDPSHAALVARLRAAIRWLSDAYNDEYGNGPSSDRRIEEEVTPLQPGDLGEGGA